MLWLSRFNLLSIVVPRYLYSSTTSTLFSWMSVSDWDGGYFLKSVHMSLVCVAFRHKYDLSYHATKSFNTGPWSTSSLDNRLSKAVSFENLIKYLYLQSFVYNINKNGRANGNKLHTRSVVIQSNLLRSPHQKIKLKLGNQFLKQQVRLQRFEGSVHIHVENSGMGFGFLQMTNNIVY